MHQGVEFKISGIPFLVFVMRFSWRYRAENFFGSQNLNEIKVVSALFTWQCISLHDLTEICEMKKIVASSFQFEYIYIVFWSKQ